jgi:hypothetical protein
MPYLTGGGKEHGLYGMTYYCETVHGDMPYFFGWACRAGMADAVTRIANRWSRVMCGPGLRMVVTHH